MNAAGTSPREVWSWAFLAAESCRSDGHLAKASSRLGFDRRDPRLRLSQACADFARRVTASPTAHASKPMVAASRRQSRGTDAFWETSSLAWECRRLKAAQQVNA